MTMAVIGQNHYVNYTPGYDEEIVVPKDKVVASWGVRVQGRNGAKSDLMMGWKVSGTRKGPKAKHGLQGKKGPLSDYSQSLFDSMFKGW